MKNPFQTAKLIRPAAFGLVPRKRLFALLDGAAANGKVAWVCGPAGAGKSSLVIGWTHSSQRQCAWYQVDARDTDPATFFHHLALLHQTIAVAPAALELPHLTPDYLPGLEVFAQRFFERFYASLPGSFTLVVDNLHELPASESMEVVVARAIRALTPGGFLVVISRSEPGAGLARASTDPGFHRVAPEDLALDDDEACLLAHGVGPHDAAGVRELNQHVRGWAAGLVLMLRARSSGVALPRDARQHSSSQALFDYIACEIFGKAPESARDLLLRTAALPYVAADVAVAPT